MTVGADTLRGTGRRYDLALRYVGEVQLVPLDSVVGIETFRTGTDVPSTVALSAPATAVGALGGIVLFKVLFGSCPTVYSDSAGTFALEAEGFSDSIAPLFERRDVDRLGTRADSVGTVQLEVRNEALETHSLNHFELIEVRHAPDETVVPDTRGAALAVRGLVAPAVAVDRAGRDLRATLASADGDVFATDPGVLAGVDLRDLGDHIDLTLPAPPGVDSVAVVLTLRNSLLTTVLLYDLMLGSAGSLDWLGLELEQVGGALELGQWYVERMGMAISVLEEGGYREVQRLPDTGPIAWKQIAAVVPVPAGDSLRVRLSFVADEWRIDRVAFALARRVPAIRTLPAARVVGGDDTPEPAALRALAAPDQEYLQTLPGQRFTLRFDAGKLASGEERTFLLASQGYCTEWIRREWLRTPASAISVRASDETLLAALEQWRTKQKDLESAFYGTRIPVR